MRRRIQITLFTVYCLLFTVTCAQVNSDSLISVYTKKVQKYLDKENKASEVFSFTKDGIEVYAPATDTSQKKLEFIVYWDIYWNDTVNFPVSGPGDIIENYFTHPYAPFDWKNFARRCKIEYEARNSGGRLIAPFYSLVYAGPKIMHGNGKWMDGYKIALDPGHIGGDIETAKMEKKWVEMKVNPAKGIKEPIQLIEGDLTLATAKILKQKLESEGADVMLTRKEPGKSAFGITYEKWKDSLFLRSVDSAFARRDVSFEEKNFLLTKANDIEIFRRFFLQEEMRERAKKINEFHPDITLIIHFNADETNQNWNKPTKKDFNMAFVGGSFGADELDKPEARIDFLRLLLTDDIERSIDFSKYMVESLAQKTNVPAALDSNAVYLKDNCISTGTNGVFCRNLALTRMVKGTLCYGESLYQDNINECKALSKKEIKIDGIETSKRVEEVAEAYFQGIINFVKNKNK
ncbi:MAG: N-acetylmuramoyl-L-alanine amidase [Bacteroidetes bacterium]|nr:N-acetylmuramoyl-L-alanine amidase [Bacteroidota bacterium]